MQKIRLRESDGLAQLNADLNDLRLGPDEVANATNDTHDTTPADDPALAAPQPTAIQPARKATITTIPLTPGRVSMITVKVVERKVRHSDLPTGLTVDEASEVGAAEDLVSSTTITLGSGRVGKNVTVSVEFSGDASDGDDEMGGFNSEESLVRIE